MIEKVNPCHPDKVADRIAGAIVDMAYRLEENPKMAVEVLIGHGYCKIMMETSLSNETVSEHLQDMPITREAASGWKRWRNCSMKWGQRLRNMTRVLSES